MVPAAPSPCRPVFKSPVSVQEDPSHVSVKALSDDGGLKPPTANVAVCIPVPANAARAEFKSATSVNVLPSYVSV